MSDNKLIQTEQEIESADLNVGLQRTAAQVSKILRETRLCATCMHEQKRHGLWNGGYCFPQCECPGFRLSPENIAFENRREEIEMLAAAVVGRR